MVPNLMIGFGIDQIQAEYVAEIKLRHLNREYILKRTEEVEDLRREIDELQGVLSSKSKVKTIIIKELEEVAKKYGQPRRTRILYADEVEEAQIVEEVPDYPVHLFFTREGYFKKITPQSLRMSGEQKLKEGDQIAQQVEDQNTAELLFFSDRSQVYKLKAADFADTKASVLGEYIPAKAQMDEGESAVYMAVTHQYDGFMLFFFENGKAAKVEMSAYQTKQNRKKLLNAYSDKSPLAAALYVKEDCEVLLTASSGRMLLFHTGSSPPRPLRTPRRPGHEPEKGPAADERPPLRRGHAAKPQPVQEEPARPGGPARGGRDRRGAAEAVLKTGKGGPRPSPRVRAAVEPARSLWYNRTNLRERRQAGAHFGH